MTYFLLYHDSLLPRIRFRYSNGGRWGNSHRKDGPVNEMAGLWIRYYINGSSVFYIRISSANGCRVDGDII
jgi:hypothetical protein